MSIHIRTAYRYYHDGKLKGYQDELTKTIFILLVEHKDRLTRFGFNYINILLKSLNKKVEVINLTDNKEDLIQDFVSCITLFCARIYGQKRSKRKTEQIIKELEKCE
jgi:putative resolvase